MNSPNSKLNIYTTLGSCPNKCNLVSAPTSTYTAMRTVHSTEAQWRLLLTRSQTQSSHRQEHLMTPGLQCQLLWQGRMMCWQQFDRNILRYNALEETFPKFYRGNIESSQSKGPGVTAYDGGQDQTAFSYYGAARILNERLVRVEEDGARPTGEVFHPTRESVEARPDLSRGAGRSLELDGHKTRFMTQHGQEFRVSRPHGHSVSYDTYQGDHSLSLSTLSS